MTDASRDQATQTARGLSPVVLAHVLAGRRRQPLRLLAAALVAVAVAALAIANRSSIGSGGSSLAGADLEWLALGMVLTTALWVAGTVAQLGAVPIRPPLKQMFAVQVAASAVNHVVPGSVGGMAVNVHYLQRSGMARPAAVAAVGLNSVATLVTHLALIATGWALAPALLPGAALAQRLAHAVGVRSGSGVGSGVGHILPSTLGLVAVASVVAVLVLVLVLLRPARHSGRRWSAWCRDQAGAAVGHLRREVGSLAAVLRHPGRASLLWAGAVASPVLHGLVLVAVYNSLTGSISAGALVLAYPVASSVAALVPSPGGFGALDVTLVAALVALGAPTTTAVAVVLGYRLLTVWVPLVPGALVFAILLRRSVL